MFWGDFRFLREFKVKKDKSYFFLAFESRGGRGIGREAFRDGLPSEYLVDASGIGLSSAVTWNFGESRDQDRGVFGKGEAIGGQGSMLGRTRVIYSKEGWV